MGKHLQPSASLDARIRGFADGPLRKQFTATVSEKAVDEVARTVRFTITTGSVDRDNDTIDPLGWDVSEFLKNPVVLWAHDYSQLPVARALDVTPSPKGLQSTAQFPPKGLHPFADTVFELIRFGILNASSVGFHPTEYTRDEERGGLNFTRQSLLEWSIVPVPANAEALATASAKGIDVTPIRAWAEGVIKQCGGASPAPLTPGEIVLTRAQQQKLTRAIAKQFVKQADPALAARLSSLDTLIDSADQIMDTILESLGIPDDDAAQEANGETVMPSSQSGPNSAGGDTSTGLPPVPMRSGRKDTAPPGQAPSAAVLCPACGIAVVNDICPGCSWRAPEAIEDVTGAPYPASAAATETMQKGRASVLRRLAEPRQANKGFSTVAGEDDPLRWNRQLSKAFDVAAEPLESSRLEYAWVSRYLETPIQQLSVETFHLPAARMGSFLAAMDEGIGAWTVDALRNMTESGREVPPVYESIQLNSRTTRSFLVEGLRFMRRPNDNAKIVSKLEPSWSGLYVTHYVRHEQAEVRTAWLQRVQQRATEMNFLRGEAFTLSGEFLDRGELDWPDLFLEPAKEAILRRSVDRINEQGEDMESRGLMLMGPPGTGKTLSGRVMMRQADTTFIWISARDFYRSGAFGAFTYAFDLAAECAPTILFFEDVDNWLGSDTIDLLKTEMDGLKRRKGVETVLTTNFPELIPDALIDRPGRFHDLLELTLPTEAVRARMLAAWLPDAPEKTRLATARLADGYSGAHLRELVNFAQTIGTEQKVGLDEALPLALEKIREQRELVASLRDAPDYRPRRQVRSLVGQAMALVAKRGRVLSATNEGKIRAAREHLDGVLGQLETLPQVDEPETMALMLHDEPAAVLDGIVLQLAENDVPTATAAEIRTALESAVKDAIGTLIREQTQHALALARGRVD